MSKFGYFLLGIATILLIIGFFPPMSAKSIINWVIVICCYLLGFYLIKRKKKIRKDVEEEFENLEDETNEKL